jgi:hypothetical protein
MVCLRSLRSRWTHCQARHDVDLVGVRGSYERSLDTLAAPVAPGPLLLVQLRSTILQGVGGAIIFVWQRCSDQLCKFDTWPVLQSWAGLRLSRKPRSAALGWIWQRFVRSWLPCWGFGFCRRGKLVPSAAPAPVGWRLSRSGVIQLGPVHALGSACADTRDLRGPAGLWRAQHDVQPRASQQLVTLLRSPRAALPLSLVSCRVAPGTGEASMSRSKVELALVGGRLK